MHDFLNTPVRIGTLKLPHRLIQGPLAGYSCAPYRALFSQYIAPAFGVSEMLSAKDVIKKHEINGRYLKRDANEVNLAYQISGNNPEQMAIAALKLESLGADIIDINCGCPKMKIRRKSAGSALIENPQQLLQIVDRIRSIITIPLTVKLRIQKTAQDVVLAKAIEDAGVDALIIHGRRWQDNYETACDFQQIAHIKQAVKIPVIANGDIADVLSLNNAILQTSCDAYMISRAASGKPWIFQSLLEEKPVLVPYFEKVQLFLKHLLDLSYLEDEFKAVLQSRSLIRYYFSDLLNKEELKAYYQIQNISGIEHFLSLKASASIYS